MYNKCALIEIKRGVDDDELKDIKIFVVERNSIQYK